MRALLIDDERLARVELRRLLEAHPAIEIVGEAANGIEAIEIARKLVPNLLFLDIQMPGMTGFEMLEHIDDVPDVIFTTAYDEFALRAFEVNALDYLMKPIAPVRLAAAIARLHPRPKTEPVQPRLEQVFVRDGERCWIVPLADISMFESEGNYTRVHFRNERPLIPRTLSSLEERLDPAIFFRADRKYLINLRWIAAVEVGVSGNLVVRLRSNHTIEMSRRQSARLKELMSL